MYLPLYHLKGTLQRGLLTRSQPRLESLFSRLPNALLAALWPAPALYSGPLTGLGPTAASDAVALAVVGLTLCLDISAPDAGAVSQAAFGDYSPRRNPPILRLQLRCGGLGPLS